MPRERLRETQHALGCRALTTAALLGTVIILAWIVMEKEWECDNPFIPTVRPSDHFEWTYAHIFMYLGYLSALLVFNLILIFTTTQDGIERPANWNVSLANWLRISSGTLELSSCIAAFGVMARPSSTRFGWAEQSAWRCRTSLARHHTTCDS